jgi:hypothetical protein
MQKRGWIHALQDADGKSRYSPEEVDAAQVRYDRIAAVQSTETRRLGAGPGAPKQVDADIVESPPLPAALHSENSSLLQTVLVTIERALLTPRQRIDELQHRVMVQLMEQNEKMHAMTLKYLDQLGSMRGEEAERTVAARILERETDLKSKAFEKLATGAERLLSGGKGMASAAIAKLTDAQLAERMGLENFWTADEMIEMGAEAKRRVEARPKQGAPTNGSAKDLQ